MTQYVEKRTVKYRQLRELRKGCNPVDHDYYRMRKVYESDNAVFKRKLNAREKIERIEEAKELDWWTS
jgi:hypothetical protein